MDYDREIFINTIITNNIEKTREFLQPGVDTTHITIGGYAIIHYLIFKKYYDLAVLILTRGQVKNINEKCGDLGLTPLHVACIVSDRRFIKLIFDYGANPHHLTYNSVHAFQLLTATLTPEEIKSNALRKLKFEFIIASRKHKPPHSDFIF